MTPARASAPDQAAFNATDTATIGELPDIQPITMSDPVAQNDPQTANVDAETSDPIVDGSPESGIAMELLQIMPAPPQDATKDEDQPPHGLDVQAIEVKPNRGSNSGQTQPLTDH